MIAIFGCGELARNFASYIPYNFAFLTTKEYLPEDKQFLGKNVVCIENFNKESAGNTGLFIPVSYKNCNKDREKIFNLVDNLGFRIESFVHPKAFVSTTSLVGKGSIIYPLANIDPNVTIGKGFCAWNLAHVGHSSTLGDFCWVTSNATICGQVEIGDRTFVGANAVIHPSVKVGKDCIISSGAIVTKDLADGSVVLEGKNNLISKKSWEIKL